MCSAGFQPELGAGWNLEQADNHMAWASLHCHGPQKTGVKRGVTARQGECGVSGEGNLSFKVKLSGVRWGIEGGALQGGEHGLRCGFALGTLVS